MFEVLCMVCKRIAGRCDIKGSTGLCDRCLDAKYPE